MEPILVGIIGIVALLIMLVLGVHIGVALGLVGFAGYVLLTGFTPAIWTLTTTMYYVSSRFAFITIPLFVFMGLLAGVGGVSRDLYKGLSMWLGRFRAALGIATVGACAGFGTVCGSSLVTASVFAKVSAPEMRQYGYDKQLAYGICSSAGMIGMLIPPSILIIIYGILTEESVGRLLIAGVSPGLLLAIFFSMTIWVIGKIRPSMIGVIPEPVPWRQRIAGLKLFWPIIVVAAIIFGGIFTGVFNPTEAGAIAAFVMLILSLFTMGKERWSQLRGTIMETAAISAMLFLILGGAAMFSRFLVRSGITTAVMEGIKGLDLTPLALVIALAGVYLILGCFLDATSMLAITIPVIYPTIKALGIDPMWYAMVVILAVHVGLITPPVGLNVYAVKGVAEPDVSLEDIFRGVLPFFAASLAALAVIIFVPWVSTILPRLMFTR